MLPMVHFTFIIRDYYRRKDLYEKKQIKCKINYYYFLKSYNNLLNKISKFLLKINIANVINIFNVNKINLCLMLNINLLFLLIK